MTVLSLVESIAEKHGYAVWQLKRQPRGAVPENIAVKRVRHEAWLAVRREFGLSYPQIARLFGGFHHTTVMCAIKILEKPPVPANLPDHPGGDARHRRPTGDSTASRSRATCYGLQRQFIDMQKRIEHLESTVDFLTAEIAHLRERKDRAA